MNDHHPPPPHHLPGTPPKPRKMEHDISQEEDIPIDAPDVEGQKMIDDLKRGEPGVKHPHAPVRNARPD